MCCYVTALSHTQGLADESEYVRDTALLAGQTIINGYAEKSVELFVPQLEIGEGVGGFCSSLLVVGMTDVSLCLYFRTFGQ